MNCFPTSWKSELKQSWEYNEDIINTHKKKGKGEWLDAKNMQL